MSITLSAVALLLVVSTTTAAACTIETGWASFYGNGDGFAWRRTASGAIYNPGKMTAAHKTLPFGSTVRVIRLDTKKSVLLLVTDRGPFIRGRIIDISVAAATALDMRREGVVRVAVMYDCKTAAQ